MSRNWYLKLVISSALIGTTQSSLAAIIQVDVNSSRSIGQPDGSPSPTASGFSAFNAQDVSVGGSTTSQSALISGHNVTFSTLGGATFQTRDRQGVNGATYPATTTGNFYRDSIQADGGASGSAGMKVQIDTLTAGTTYELTLWTHEVNTSDPPDGITIKDVNNANATIGSGTFPGSPQVPSELTVSRFNVLAKADGSGVLNVDLIHTGNGGGGSFIFGALPLNGFILSSSTLSVDINSSRLSTQPNGSPSPTAPGFSPFDALDTSVGGSNSSQSAFIDGHNVTLTAVGGAVFQTRDREGVNGADFPNPPSVIGDLYRDSIQADGGTNGAAGMELNIDGLAVNSLYSLTLWTHEVFENGTTTDTVTITDANNGNAILGSGPFPGSPQVPTDFSSSRFDVVAMTDASGMLTVNLLHSWTGASPVVGALALNGFQLNLIPVPEPSTFAMLACAGILLFGGARRRPTARR